MEKNYFALLKNRGVEFYDPEREELAQLANELSHMAAEKKITVTACCEPLFTGPAGIKKAVCIDVARLGDLKRRPIWGKYPKEPPGPLVVVIYRKISEPTIPAFRGAPIAMPQGRGRRRSKTGNV